MHKMLLDVPTHFETERLLVRAYRPGDGDWYYAMAQQNREHLLPYEADNVALSVKSAVEGEILVRELAAEWVARNCFFMGAFEKKAATFVAQLYIGPRDWNVPEFEIGFFVDQAHQGHGYVTEMVRGALKFIFDHLQAHRVSLRCADTNVRSIRVAERCGFVREAHLRERERKPDGALHGTLVYGLLRTEFEGHHDL